MLPVHGALFAAMHSMMNFQMVFSYTVMRYVTKYLVKMDKNSHTVCSVNLYDKGDVRAKSMFLHNTEISSSSYYEQKCLEKQRDRSHPAGCIIAWTEIIQLLIGNLQVYTDLQFIKVDTTPLEDCTGLHKLPKTITRRPSDPNHLHNYQSRTGNNTINFVIMLDYVCHHLGFPDDQLFTPSQVLIINDNYSSEVTISKATIFSVRPPELRQLFPSLTNYF